jgi:hypothetical protein
VVGVSQSLIVMMIAALVLITGLVIMLRAVSDAAGQASSANGPTRGQRAWSGLHDRVLWRRGGIAVGAAVVAGLFTGWPVAAVLAAGGSWFLPALIGRDTATTALIARIEAIASWAEMMRDTLAAAAGLEQAVLATAAAAPAPIREQVAVLASSRTRYGPSHGSLRIRPAT